MVVHTYDLRTPEAKAGDSKFEASIGYLVRPYLKKIKKKYSSFMRIRSMALQEINLRHSSNTKQPHADSILSPHCGTDF